MIDMVELVLLQLITIYNTVVVNVFDGIDGYTSFTFNTVITNNAPSCTSSSSYWKTLFYCFIVFIVIFLKIGKIWIWLNILKKKNK
jgi:hypothetical protein